MSVMLGKLRIGEVHSLLRDDFPDIELSKIRYYEDKGLVLPARSRKGYRLYSERDVACLREAIRLAQEEFVPLRVVRLRLIEQGLLDDATAIRATRQMAREEAVNAVSAVAPAVTPSTNPSVRTRLGAVPTAKEKEEASRAAAQSSDGRQFFSGGEFLTTTQLDPRVVNQLVSLGLLTPVTLRGETAYTDLDVRVASAVTLLLARGADLRLLGSLRRIVEREVAVIEDLTRPLRAPGSRVSREEVSAVQSAVAREVAVLRGVLHERAINDYLAQ